MDSIRRVQPGASPSSAHSSLGLPLSSPISVGSVGLESGRSSKRHGKGGKGGKDAAGPSSRAVGAGGMFPEAQEPLTPSGLDSKRTVRKKVVLAGAAGASAAASSESAVTASPRVSPAVPLGALPPGSTRLSVVQSSGSASSSERLRARGANLAPLSGAGTGLSKATSASPNTTPTSASGKTPSANQVADAPLESLTPKLAMPSGTSSVRGTAGRKGKDKHAAGGGGDPDSEEEQEAAQTREYHKRFAPRTAGGGGAGAAMTSGALRGARMDETGLAPEYADQVRRNPFLWADYEFALANKTHTDCIFLHYTSHQKSSFVGKEPRQQHMDSAALVKLANDCVERFLQRHREHIARTNPKFAEQDIEEALHAELPHTRMGAGLQRTPVPQPQAHAAVAPADAAASPANGGGSSGAAAAGGGGGGGVGSKLAGLGGKMEAALRGAVTAVPMRVDLVVLKQHVLATLRRELDNDRDKHISRTDFLMKWKPTVTKLQTVEKESKDLCVIL